MGAALRDAHPRRPGADVQRRRDTPLFLYEDFPDGQHEVPMDTAIPVRPQVAVTRGDDLGS
jgi:hypothetical protein